MPRIRPAASAGLFALLALLSGAVLATPEAAAESTNRLVNPGFEELLAGHPWMPAGWDTSNSGLPTTFFSRDTFSVHGGMYSAAVASASALYPVSHNWSQSVLVAPGDWSKDVVFSVWTRSLGVEGRAYVMVQAFRDTISSMAKIWKMDRDLAARKLGINRIDDPLYDVAWKRQVFEDPETPWVRREVRAYMPPGTDIVFVRCGVIGIGQVILDDAALTFETAQPAPELVVGKNLIEDPGFEGNLGTWEFSMPPYPDIQVKRDSSVVRSGRYSILMDGSRATAMVGGRTGVSQVLCNRNLGGKRVRLVGYVKPDTLKSLAYAKIFAHTRTGVFQEVAPDGASSTKPWTPLTVEMDLPADTYSVWVWFAYTAPAHGLLRVDDVSLQVLGPAGAGAQPINTSSGGR